MVPVRNSANASGPDWIGLKTTSDSVLKSVSRVPLFGGFFGLACCSWRSARCGTARGAEHLLPPAPCTRSSLLIRTWSTMPLQRGDARRA